MQSATLFVLVCLTAMAAARIHYDSPALDAVDIPDDASAQEMIEGSPALERSPRTKRGLLLLKKKLLLGALGLKAAKVGAGVAGVVVLKNKFKKSVPIVHHIPYGHHAYHSHGPNWNVEVHSWSG